jgi:hypothetical protein
MTDVNKYRVWCNTESGYVSVWAEAEPSDCPNNNGHTIDSTKTAITDAMSSQLMDTKQVFLPTGLKVAAFGFKFTATKNTETSFDHKLIQDVRLRGGAVETEGHVMGDKADLSIVDVDNILGFGAGLVVALYFDGWNIPKSGVVDVLEPTMGDNVPKDLYVRCIYTSVGDTDDVKVGVNLRAYRDV